MCVCAALSFFLSFFFSFSLSLSLSLRVYVCIQYTSAYICMYVYIYMYIEGYCIYIYRWISYFFVHLCIHTRTHTHTCVCIVCATYSLWFRNYMHFQRQGPCIWFLDPLWAAPYLTRWGRRTEATFSSLSVCRGSHRFPEELHVDDGWGLKSRAQVNSAYDAMDPRRSHLFVSSNSHKPTAACMHVYLQSGPDHVPHEPSDIKQQGICWRKVSGASIQAPSEACARAFDEEAAGWGTLPTRNKPRQTQNSPI